MKRLSRLLTKTFIIAIVIFAILVVYWAINPNSVAPSWTGFGPYNEITQGPRAKTLWDWMDLLLVPVMIAIGAWWLNRSEKETERELAQDNIEEQTLQRYFDRMSTLLIQENLNSTPKTDSKWDIARAYTITTLRALNPERKGILIKFLQGADLITQEARIDLKEADLRYANLSNIDLKEANLTGADLRSINTSHTKLHNVKIDEATLIDDKFARVRNLILEGAEKRNLQGANFSYTTLKNVDLRGADLRGAIFSKASVNGITINPSWNLRFWKLNKSAKDYSYADLTGITFKDAILKNVDFTGATIEIFDADNTTAIDKKWSVFFGLKGFDSAHTSEREIRVVLVGMSGTGKTSLIRRMVGIGQLKEDTQTTTSDISIHQSEIRLGLGDKSINLAIADYAGAKPSQIAINPPESFFGKRGNRLITSALFVVDFPSRIYIESLEMDIKAAIQEHVDKNLMYFNSYTIESFIHIILSSKLKSIKLIINKLDIAREWVAEGTISLRKNQTIESYLLALYDPLITNLQKASKANNIENFSVYFVSAATGENIDRVIIDIVTDQNKT